MTPASNGFDSNSFLEIATDEPPKNGAENESEMEQPKDTMLLSLGTPCGAALITIT